MRFLVSRAYTLALFGVVFWALYAIYRGRVVFGAYAAIVWSIALFVGTLLARMSTDTIADWGSGMDWNKRCQLALTEGVILVLLSIAVVFWLGRAA